MGVAVRVYVCKSVHLCNWMPILNIEEELFRAVWKEEFHFVNIVA